MRFAYPDVVFSNKEEQTRKHSYDWARTFAPICETLAGKDKKCVVYCRMLFCEYQSQNDFCRVIHESNYIQTIYMHFFLP